MTMNDDSTATVERIKTDYIRVDPKKYNVMLINDSTTTQEFVVAVLETIFDKHEEEAIAIMLAVHHKGAGVAGTYVEDVAKTKQAQTLEFAKANGFPLKVTIEEE
jgi:ATP-dependent Clp protease adaptor protein ClpS